MVGYMKYKDEVPQEDQTKKGKTLRNNQGNQTSNLSTKTPTHMEDSFHVSRYITKTVPRN